jgi:hypothetical protein
MNLTFRLGITRLAHYSALPQVYRYDGFIVHVHTPLPKEPSNRLS